MLPRRPLRRPAHRVREAREFLRFVASSVREPQAGLGRILAEEADLLDGVPDDYLYHEHLDEVNHPVYFHQFVDHAAAHGLQYLWESKVGEPGGDLSPEAILRRGELASGLVEQQQYIDFLTGAGSALACYATRESPWIEHAP